MNNPYISKIHIEYSNLDPVNITDLSPNLNVIYGNNESGKTRIRDFISWMLFANEDKYNSDKTKKINTLYKNTFNQIDESTKGEIEILSSLEKNTIYQELNNTILVNKISPQNTDFRHKITDGISFDNYSSIYSLSLDEINETKSKEMLSDKSQLEYIFGAIQAKTTTSPALLIKTLKEKCDQLFAESSGAKKEINSIIKKIDDIKKEIKIIKSESKEDTESEKAIESLNSKKTVYKSDLESIETILNKQKVHLLNIDLYEKYKELKSIRTKDFNEKIVNEINEIDVLIKQSVHLLSEENDIAILEKEKNDLDKEIERLTIRLEATLKPDNATPYLLSHEFESLIENELSVHSKASDSVDRLKNEIKNIESKIILSKKQLEFQKQAPKEYVTPPVVDEETTVKIETTTKHTILPMIIIFTLFIVAGIIAANLLLIAIGTTSLVVTGISYLLFVKDKISQIPVLENDTLLKIELEHIKHELVNKKSEIETINKEILEGSENYKTSCLKAGFVENIEPKHLQKYIKDFDTLSLAYAQLDKINLQVERQSARINSYYNKLKDLASSTNYSPTTSNSFLSITHAKHWLETFQQYALEQKELFEDKNKYHEELAKLENQLSDQYKTLDNAIKELSNQSKASLFVDLSRSEKELLETKQKLEDTIHDLGTLEEKQKNLNKSTKIQDLLLEQEACTIELAHLHEKYKLSFTSFKVAENAFKKWQENFQPEVTKKASELFVKMTNKKWSSLQADIDSLDQPKNQQSFFNVKNENTILESNKLSRGASEQLFLAFRIAVIQTNKRAPYIPVMFDDISVNFDRNRFETIAPILKELAENRQVFYFTCHEWVRDTLTEKAGAKVFTL